MLVEMPRGFPACYYYHVYPVLHPTQSPDVILAWYCRGILSAERRNWWGEQHPELKGNIFLVASYCDKVNLFWGDGRSSDGWGAVKISHEFVASNKYTKPKQNHPAIGYAQLRGARMVECLFYVDADGRYIFSRYIFCGPQKEKR